MTKTRQLEIAKCINIAAKYYAISAKQIYFSRNAKDPLIHKARVLVWYHLHKSGVSYHDIATAFKLSYDNVQARTRQGRSLLTEEDLLLVATMPRIETTAIPMAVQRDDF